MFELRRNTPVALKVGGADRRLGLRLGPGNSTTLAPATQVVVLLSDDSRWASPASEKGPAGPDHRRDGNEELLRLASFGLRTRRSTRPSPATASATVLRRLLRRQTPEETSHRAPDLGLHQLTNDRDDALASRHPLTSLLPGACPIQDCPGSQIPAANQPPSSPICAQWLRWTRLEALLCSCRTKSGALHLRTTCAGELARVRAELSRSTSRVA